MGGEPRGLDDVSVGREEVEIGTVKERRLILVNTENASSRSATA